MINKLNFFGQVVLFIKIRTVNYVFIADTILSSSQIISVLRL